MLMVTAKSISMCKVRKDQVTGGKFVQAKVPGKVHLAELRTVTLQPARTMVHFGSLTPLHNILQARNATKTGVLVVQNVLGLAFAHF